MWPPMAAITPLAPDEGISSSAVTECDLFLVLIAVFSPRRRIPENRSCVLPCTTSGRPARSGVRALRLAIVEREHVVLGGFEIEETLHLGDLLRQLLREVVRL